jgi:trehalose transport system permease protein
MHHKLEIAMVTPFTAYVLFFMFVPVVQSIYFSFVKSGMSTPTLDNYQTILDRSQISDAFVNTLGITAFGVSMEMVFGMIIALMLSRAFRGRGLFRSIVLIPLGVPTLVAGAAMLYFIGFNGDQQRSEEASLPVHAGSGTQPDTAIPHRDV